jgi:phosphoribosylformylglycinamidine synthase
MSEVKRFAREGRMVVGICNGFQILCEAGMLPGALLPNCHLRYCCQWVYLKAEGFDSAFSLSRNAKILRMPISHYEGNYYAPPDILEELEAEHRVAFRYSTPEGRIESEVNPNGSLNNIAGILNKRGNVLGMMPHPERACEELLGSADGNLVWQSIMDAI